MDYIEEFLSFAQGCTKWPAGVRVPVDPLMIRAVTKELKRLRGAEERRAELSRKNGRAGGRPLAPESEIKPASLKRRQYRKKRGTNARTND